MEYICDICGKGFKSKFALGPHKHISHNPHYVKPLNGNRGKPSWNSGLTALTDVRVEKYSSTLKSRIAVGDIIYPNTGVPRSAEIREKISKTLLANTNYTSPRGGRKTIKTTDTFGNLVILQSTYELTLSDDLNSNFVKWIRPKCLRYLAEDGKSRRYYPDFYLVDYDMYLDPKNDYLIMKDAYKINCVRCTHGIKLLVLNKHQLTWDFVKSQIGSLA